MAAARALNATSPVSTFQSQRPRSAPRSTSSSRSSLCAQRVPCLHALAGIAQRRDQHLPVAPRDDGGDQVHAEHRAIGALERLLTELGSVHAQLRHQFLRRAPDLGGKEDREVTARDARRAVPQAALDRAVGAHDLTAAAGRSAGRRRAPLRRRARTPVRAMRGAACRRRGRREARETELSPRPRIGRTAPGVSPEAPHYTRLVPGQRAQFAHNAVADAAHERTENGTAWRRGRARQAAPQTGSSSLVAAAGSGAADPVSGKKPPTTSRNSAPFSARVMRSRNGREPGTPVR